MKVAISPKNRLGGVLCNLSQISANAYDPNTNALEAGQAWWRQDFLVWSDSGVQTSLVQLRRFFFIPTGENASPGEEQNAKSQKGSMGSMGCMGSMSEVDKDSEF